MKTILSTLPISMTLSLFACAPNELPQTDDPAESTHRAEMDRYIRSLPKFSEGQVAEKDAAVGDVIPAKTAKDCPVQRRELTRVPGELVPAHRFGDTLFTGGLVVGKDAREGQLNPIPTQRGGGDIVLTQVTGIALDEQRRQICSKHVEAMTLEQVTSAEREILARCLATVPANFDLTYKNIYTNKQLKVEASVNVGAGTWDVGAALQIDDSKQMNRVLWQLTQVYYTIAMAPPATPSAFFGAEVTPETLRPFVSASSPPLYIKQRTFGRRFYLLFETEDKTFDLQAAIHAAYSGGITANASLKAKYLDKYQQTTVRVVAQGGDADKMLAGALQLALGSKSTSKASALQNFANEESKKGVSKAGETISYVLGYVTDSSQFQLQLNTSYDQPLCTGCAAQSYLKDDLSEFRMIFKLKDKGFGEIQAFKDGKHHEGCDGVSWKNVSFQCRAGTWAMDPYVKFGEDDLCSGNENDGPGDPDLTGQPNDNNVVILRH